jgi:hypothetical protein
MDISSFITAVNNKDTAGIIKNGEAIIKEVKTYVTAAKKFEAAFTFEDGDATAE